jgi:hypothetical protein
MPRQQGAAAPGHGTSHTGAGRAPARHRRGTAGGPYQAPQPASNTATRGAPEERLQHVQRLDARLPCRVTPAAASRLLQEQPYQQRPVQRPEPRAQLPQLFSRRRQPRSAGRGDARHHLPGGHVEIDEGDHICAHPRPPYYGAARHHLPRPSAHPVVTGYRVCVCVCVCVYVCVYVCVCATGYRATCPTLPFRPYVTEPPQHPHTGSSAATAAVSTTYKEPLKAADAQVPPAGSAPIAAHAAYPRPRLNPGLAVATAASAAGRMIPLADPP